MGSGASPGVAVALAAASQDELQQSLAGLPAAEVSKLRAAVDAACIVSRCQSSVELLEAIKSGRRSCVAIMKELLERIKQVDSQVNSCPILLEENALARAAAVDAKVASGEALRSLEGLPILVKLNMDLAGTISSANTPALKDWKPSTTASCVQKLLDAGAIPLAKTNMPELSLRMDGFSQGPHGSTHNPYSLEHSPGGSSSGTAAGIAIGAAPCGLGSDTAGSLRLPAVCCGIVGFRPSHGRWPHDGIVPIDGTKDTPGPMGASVADVALLDAVINDEEPVSVADLKGIRFLLPEDWIDSLPSLDDTCRKALDETVGVLQKVGAVVERRSDFKPIAVDMKASSVVQQFSADMQAYLEKHPDRPEDLTVAKVAELCQNHGKFVFAPPKDDDWKPKVAEMKAEIEKQEVAYSSYMKDNNFQAVIVPAMHFEPYLQKDESPPELNTNFSVALIAGNLVQIKAPSLTLLTKVKYRMGAPASVMLYGTDDRQVLSIGLGIERALA